MKTPGEFNKFCKALIQSFQIASSISDKAITSAFENLNESEKGIVKQFVDSLLNGQSTEAEIQQAWHDALPEYRISGDASGNNYRSFLTKVREIIEPKA